MNIVVKITPENTDELYGLVLEYRPNYASVFHSCHYLNLDSEWEHINVPLYPLREDSVYVQEAQKVSFEDFKVKLFNYLLER